MNTVLVHLNLIKGVGPATIEKIVGSLTTGELQHIYDYTEQDFVHRGGVSLAQAKLLFEGLRDIGMLERELAYAQRNEIQLICLDDPHYPPLLRTIYLPPPVLYIQGTIVQPLVSVALVGSREADIYAKKFIDACVPSLVASSVGIVSGGAYGADTMAHEATVAFGGLTTVVLGSGLKCLYPSSNKRLFARIRESKGVLLSPFPLDAEPLPNHFPMRNRIIAGLSSLCVVVQAAAKSGALITARFALEQAREIGAVPGDVNHPLSKGCHELLKEGAHIVTDAPDIFAVLGFKSTQAPLAAKKEETEVDLGLPAVLKRLCSQRALSLEEMVVGTGSSLTDIQNALFDLHIQGKVKETIAGYWQAY